jgi:hypothetical protein
MRQDDAAGVFLLLIMGIAGVLGAIWLGDRFGCIGYVFGPSLGAAVVLGIVCAGAVAWVAIQNLLFRGIPWLPVCRNGCCRGGRLADPGDYALVWNDDWTLKGFRCRCGITYKKIGRRFVEIAEDGSLQPYLVWSLLKGWSPDREETR